MGSLYGVLIIAIYPENQFLRWYEVPSTYFQIQETCLTLILKLTFFCNNSMHNCTSTTLNVWLSFDIIEKQIFQLDRNDYCIVKATCYNQNFTSCNQ